MTEVTQAFKKNQFITRLWLSKKALAEAEKFSGSHDSPEPERFWKKIKHFLKIGLSLAERGTPPIVKYEWRGVYRFGLFGSLFRLVGFYEDDSKHDFIVIDAFNKRGTKLSNAQIARINAVADIKDRGDWKKVD